MPGGDWRDIYRFVAWMITGSLCSIGFTACRHGTYMMDQNSVAVKGSLSWADSETLLRVRRQIDEGFLEPVTIAELSKQHFMCESKLREIFRKHYGITIYQYMLNRRMEHACELLSVPDAQVKDIAGLVGYSNISHFSDAFRKKFGCTPSEYKRGLPF